MSHETLEDTGIKEFLVSSHGLFKKIIFSYICFIGTFRSLNACNKILGYFQGQF